MLLLLQGCCKALVVVRDLCLRRKQASTTWERLPERCRCINVFKLATRSPLPLSRTLLLLHTLFVLLGCSPFLTLPRWISAPFTRQKNSSPSRSCSSNACCRFFFFPVPPLPGAFAASGSPRGRGRGGAVQFVGKPRGGVHDGDAPGVLRCPPKSSVYCCHPPFVFASAWIQCRGICGPLYTYPCFFQASPSRCTIQ